LVPLLLSKLSPEHEASTQTSAGDFMKAIITISANATAQDNNVVGPNELTRQLVSEECIQMLIKDMLRGGNLLTVGVGIVIEVIRKNNSDYDLENQSGPIPKSTDPIYLGTLLRQFAIHIPDFMDLIKIAESNKKELKVAFGKKIEPLGFDRFKTCELMAELLHCSNMILLNQRGSEAEIKARDAERARLKAEGKLTAFNDDISQDFGTSVDSSGFHHARAPSFGDEKIKRLEVSNSTDEDFENVTASEALVDEIKDDFDEKESETDTITHHSQTIDQSIKEIDDLTQLKKDSVEPTVHSSAETSKEHESSTTDMTENFSAITINDNGPSSPKTPTKRHSAGRSQDLSPHPEDKPAPLFSGKAKSEEKPPSADSTTIEQSENDVDMAVFSSDIENDLPYEPDIDGTPVVGDLLKIKFVEHRVVPTILVRSLSPNMMITISSNLANRTSSFVFLGIISYIMLYMMWCNRFSTVKWNAALTVVWQLTCSTLPP
jgi:SIT4-associating protein SAP185/190